MSSSPKKRYYIVTYGCQMNKSDSERIAGKLEKGKYQPAKNIKRADLVVVNACAVRQSAMDRIYSKIERIRQIQPKTRIILTGCLLKADQEKLKNQVDEIWPPADLDAKPKCQSKKSAFVPIMTGCNNFCSYCAVPYTRGREYSLPAGQIVKQIKSLIKNGCQEITLLGQNVNSYKSQSPRNKAQETNKLEIQNSKNRTINFAQLLKIISDIPGNFEIRFLTSHPKDFSDELIKTIAQNKKISKEIHLPVQSGDNQILKKMNRGYTVSHYKKLIKRIRKAIPESEISTDIIVGFPGETKTQFQNTVKLVKEIGFKQIYAAAYSPRIGTAAAKLKETLTAKEKKQRKKIILDIVKDQNGQLKNAAVPNNKLIVILGPTASGKSGLAVKLAKKLNGEVISADSRQIYQGMDIGTAKITKKEMDGIPHYLIDIVKPNQSFTLAQYQKLAIKTIKDIQRRNKIPFLVGGTGLYIQAIVDNLKIPRVKPDKKLREKLEKLSSQGLFKKLKKLDPGAIKFIDPNNKRRLIRALEVCLKTKIPFSAQRKKQKPVFDTLQIGLSPNQETLEKRINQRTKKMFQLGLIQENKKLIKKYSSALPSVSGIGYQEIISYFNNEINLEQARELIKTHTRQYARRQMTWFKRDKRIVWVRSCQQAQKIIKGFL